MPISRRASQNRNRVIVAVLYFKQLVKNEVIDLAARKAAVIFMAYACMSSSYCTYTRQYSMCRMTIFCGVALAAIGMAVGVAKTIIEEASLYVEKS